jgi:hypothetical protein
MRRRFATAMVIAAGLLGFSRDVRAQPDQPPIIPPLIIGSERPAAWNAALEIAPFGGYRFGGDFFELVTGQRVDLDGAPVWGIAVDVPLAHQGLSFEALFTHQHANLTVPSAITALPRRWHITVEHWQAGVLQEINGGRARPFIDVMAGLTRYSGEGDNEFRFAASLGAGAKLLPSERFGIRMESRVFATLVDAAGALVCAGGCLLALSADVVWQWEFSAGLIVRIQ